MAEGFGSKRVHMCVAHLHDWVSDGGHALIKGFCDDGKASSICANKGGKICHQMNGSEVISVSDLQSLQQRRQAVIAKA